MVKYNILTQREEEIINKKFKGISLTQNESNILSKFVRPKLREISKIDANVLLNRLEYNQISKSIENKIKKLILDNIKETKAILIYGSAIQTNYKEYNDIDILIITNKKTWNSSGDKYDLIVKLTDLTKKEDLELDIQILDIYTFNHEYPHSPSLIYQLKDSKIIYGKMKMPTKVELSKLDLRMKLDWSDIDDENSKGGEIYQALRNVILVRLLLNKIINNNSLKEKVNRVLGDNIINKLKNNIASKSEKRVILEYIKNLAEQTDEEIKSAKWEKIAL